MGVVFVDRRIRSAAADGNAHRRRILFVDVRAQHLPRGIERIGDGDIFEGGQRGQPARRLHLIDVIRGRLVCRGIEIVRLRIGAVAVVDHLVGGKQRLLVDDVHRKGGPGEPVHLFEVVDEHVGVRLALLPGRIDAVVRGSAARSFAPDDAVAHVAELPRRVDHARSGDIRLDKNVVRELLEGAHLLLEHGIDDAAHLRIPIVLPHEAGVHVADIFERGVHIGRGAVLRERIGDGDEPLVDDVGRALLKKERVDAEYADGEHGGNGKARQHLGDAAMIF